MKNTNKLVISVILNVILLGFVIHPWLTRNNNDDVIERLQMENKSLLYSVDSLFSVNDTLIKQNEMIVSEIIKVENELILNNTKIKDLKNGKDKVPTFVNNLSVNGVTWELSRYLNERTK